MDGGEISRCALLGVFEDDVPPPNQDLLFVWSVLLTAFHQERFLC